MPFDPPAESRAASASGDAAPCAALTGVRRIVFASDLLRVDDWRRDRRANPQRVNVVMLEALLGGPLREATGLESGIALFDEPAAPVDRFQFYLRLGVDFSSHGWASLYEAAPPAAEAALLAPFRDAFAVLFEGPPYLLRLLEREGIPFLNLRVHPVRFMDDYMLGAATNIPALAAWLGAHATPPALIDRQARLLSALARRRLFASERLPEDAAVFFGQTEVDAALIADGRIAGRRDVENALRRLAAERGAVFYKRHPHNADAGWVEALTRSDPRIQVIDHNAYDLLGCGRATLAAALSSSVLSEARWFGVEARRLLPGDDGCAAPGAAPDAARCVPLRPCALETDFWRAAFEGAPWTPDADTLDFRDGALKRALNQTWGR
jgi:hypothetical protein